MSVAVASPPTMPEQAGAASWRAGGAGSSFTAAVGGLQAGMREAVSASGQIWREQERELQSCVAGLDELRTDLDRITLSVVVEAMQRGLPQQTSLSLHDWIARVFPARSRSEVGDLAVVARDATTPGHEPMHAAVREGRLPLRRAARLVRCLARVRPVAEPETYEADLTTLLSVAVDPGYTDAELGRVTDHLLSVAVSEAEHEQRAQAQRDLRGVHESSLADGSLTRFVVTADSEGAATLRAVLTSPLAAPAPDDDGPDPRSATQRRYDALMTVLGRGVSAPGAAPTTAKARLMVTVSYDVLSQRLDGLGVTETGQTLSPQTVRRLACTAEIIPAVLGTYGEVLDLGRASRLATPAQHLLLWRRDRHCTYAGCRVPPQWCDAHHLSWWSRGGRTDLENLALLCGRHHSLVHQRDLHGQVVDGAVVWRE